MDLITIKELEVHYRVGVPEAERAKAQKLRVSIEMHIDFSRAADSDELAQTIDYFEVAQRVLRFGESRSWKLIETVAVDLAEMILTAFKPRRVSVEIQKFIIPEARYVAVSVTRPPKM